MGVAWLGAAATLPTAALLGQHPILAGPPLRLGAVGPSGLIVASVILGGLGAAAGAWYSVHPGSGLRHRSWGAVIGAFAPGLLVGAVFLAAFLDPGRGTLPVARAVPIASIIVAPAAFLLAPLIDGSPRATPLRVSPRAAWLGTLVGLTAFAVGIAVALAVAAPFGWDESAYAVLSRNWVAGTPSTGWAVYRPPLLSVLGTVPAVFTEAEWAFRIMTVGWCLLAALASGLLAQAAAGRAAAVLAVGVIASASRLQLDGGLFQNDLPSAGVLCILVFVLAGQLGRERLGASFLLVPVLAALALYWRYAAIYPLAGVTLAAVIVGWQPLRRSWRVVGAGAVLFTVLMLPHAVFAQVVTGEPWGIFLRAQGAAAPPGLGTPLGEYLATAPALFGPLMLMAALLGLTGGIATLVTASVRRQWTTTARTMTLLLVVAVWQLLAMGLFVHAEPRYLTLTALLLCAAGAAVTVQLIQRGTERMRLVAVASIGLILVVAWVGSIAVVDRGSDARAEGIRWVRELGSAIRSDVAGGECGVLAANVAQLTWYSGCLTKYFGQGDRADRHTDLPGRRYLVVLRSGFGQPSRDVLLEYLDDAEAHAIAQARSSLGVVKAWVYRFLSSPPGSIPIAE